MEPDLSSGRVSTNVAGDDCFEVGRVAHRIRDLRLRVHGCAHNSIDPWTLAYFHSVVRRLSGRLDAGLPLAKLGNPMGQFRIAKDNQSNPSS